MTDCVECRKCGSLCYVEWDGYKPLTWCDACNDYPDIDWEALSADWLATKIDAAYEKSKYEH